MPGILTDTAIGDAIQDGSIKINPWNPDQLNPCSYDVTLGSGVAVYTNWVLPYTRSYGTLSGATPPHEDGRNFVINPSGFLDVKDEPRIERFTMDKEAGWVLKPGILYLMHTVETITTDKYDPILDGKSSIGRLGILVHLTAGFGDPGYFGQYTLEVMAVHPVRIYPGMRIGQMRFHTLEGELGAAYNHRKSNYLGEAAMGAVPSRAFKMFGPKG